MIKFFPKYLQKFFLKIGIFLIVFSLCRVIFYSFNTSHFPTVEFSDFIYGIWFDLVTTAIIVLPLVVFEIFPNKWRNHKYYKLLLAILFYGFLFIGVLLNLADIEYFKFTSSRLSASTFTMLAYGNDFSQQLPSFISSYWYLFLIAIFLMWLAVFLYKKIQRIEDDSESTSWGKQSLVFILTAGLLVVTGRGTGLRPIEPINVTAYAQDQNVPLVLNSAFTVIKSWGKQSLDEKFYFKPSELTTYFNPIKQYDNSAELNQPNIVVLMLESFSVEYIASINGTNEVNTPFLDSLIGESLVYTNCYANGKKSIDAVPSVISSVPKLMPQEFITSAYSTNKIESLPKHLNALGYETAFFHGATNGSMNFDQFASKVDFDHYFGRTEYNNDADYDGTWGIYDEEFFVWSAQQMTQMKKPFFSTIFSLSSHPPYAIPEQYQSIFTGGETDMHNSVNYTDFAIRQFFNYAKKQDWYNNTLFIITADHTPATSQPEYYKDMGSMHIPLVFFHPNDSTFKGQSNKVVGQIDIMPTIFDLIGYDQPFYSFGQSIFKDNEGFSVVYHNNKYLIYGQDFMLTFQHDKPLGLYNLKDRLLDPNQLSEQPKVRQFLENKIKAYIQTYNYDLIHNQMTAE